MKKDVTVIYKDRFISVDGEGLFFDFSIPEGLEECHAIQWHNGKGHKELLETMENVSINYEEDVLPYVGLWQEEKKRRDEEAAQQPIIEEEKAEAMATADILIMNKVRASYAQKSTFTASEFSVMVKAGLFNAWKAGEVYSKGYRIEHNGIVYEVMQDVEATENQPPNAEGMLAVYRPLSVDAETGEEPDGSMEHPYTFIYGMDVAKDKYYLYEEKIYIAKADMPACVWYPGTEGLWQWEEVETAEVAN